MMDKECMIILEGMKNGRTRIEKVALDQAIKAIQKLAEVRKWMNQEETQTHEHGYCPWQE